jgi:carboxypeptidase Q
MIPMRSKTLFAALAALVIGGPSVATHAAAQQLATEDPVLSAIWSQAMEHSELERMAQALLDSIGPRLTASPQMERAQAWAVRQLGSWGIDAKTEEYGSWEGWDRGPSHIDLLEPRVRSLEGRILAWSPGTDGEPVDAGVVPLPNMKTAADFEAFLPSVKGKFVMISFPQPTCRVNDQLREFATEESLSRMMSARRAAQRVWNASVQATGLDRRALPRALEAAGAAGVISSTWSDAFGTTRVFNAYTRDVPTFELGCEDYGLVYRLAKNGQAPLLRLTAESHNRGEVPVFNVIGRIPSTEKPNEYVMLSAHFDSWEGGSGATDNGSGSLLMLETMRILQTVYPNPKRTILLGLWSGEEQGLNGSRAFTEDHPEVIEGLQALFNQDNGTGRVVSLSASGFIGAGPSLARWMSKVPAEVARNVRLSFPGSPAGGGSDHASFVCWGAPGFSLGALNWDYFSHTWHTHRDTFDKLVFDDLKNNAVLAASLAYLAAEDPQMTDREKSTNLRGRNGQPAQWPACQPSVRKSSDSSRM